MVWLRSGLWGGNRLPRNSVFEASDELSRVDFKLRDQWAKRMPVGEQGSKAACLVGTRKPDDRGDAQSHQTLTHRSHGQQSPRGNKQTSEKPQDGSEPCVNHRTRFMRANNDQCCWWLRHDRRDWPGL